MNNIEMLYYDKIDVSEGFDVRQANQKSAIIVTIVFFK